MVSRMHPSFAKIQVLKPMIPQLSFVTIWGILKMIDGMTYDVKMDQVSEQTVRNGVKTLLVEVESQPNDYSILSFIRSLIFLVFKKQKHSTLRRLILE